MTHKKVLLPHEKSISEARINYTRQDASKFFFRTIHCVFEVKSKKKNSENYIFSYYFEIFGFKSAPESS